jgi:hypothetical protein
MKQRADTPGTGSRAALHRRRHLPVGWGNTTPRSFSGASLQGG